MRFYIFLLILLLSATIRAEISIRPDHCKKETLNDLVLYGEDFRWNYSLAEMLARYEEIYNSDKRLKLRAYYDLTDKKIKVPFIKNENLIAIPDNFLNSIKIHIEEALHKKVIEAVFFPDLGHSHFYIPQDKWEKMSDTSNQVLLYEKIFAEPGLKILYHTAEQLKLWDENRNVLPDPYILFRWQTRNLVGFNNGSHELMFLKKDEDIPNHFYYSGGFNISANKNGCFYYIQNGNKIYYDISMADLEYKENLDGY